MRRSGLVVARQTPARTNPGSSLDVAHENFCVASLDKMFTHTVTRPTQPGLGLSVGKIGEWAMCLRIERWPGVLDKL